ncbi:MAG: hypothetical protein MUC29_03325 [Pyrinomonadaceae bacterium]|jgi:hypothetical protein|nr:hypothetical protein [Pyrinomonadaceae bacterium]
MELGLKEKYINCRYCNEVVSSFAPICKKCGLEMTSEGIIELAEIEELTIDAKEDALRLNLISGFCLCYTIIGGIILFPLTNYVGLINSSFIVAFFYYLFALFKWQKKYSKIILQTDELFEAKINKRASIIVFFVSIFINFLFYWFGK